MKHIIAIDPGASGGIAWTGEETIECAPMPETQGDILELLHEIMILVRPGCEVVAFIEDVPKFVGKAIPSSTSAVLFENYGFIKGVLAGRYARMILVRPQLWQKHFHLGTKSKCASTTEWKNKLKAEAQRRFPLAKVTLKTADALLILDYARESGGTND